MSMVFCRLCEKETTHHSYFERGRDWEYGVPGEFRQEQCDECGLVASVPMPTLEEILSYYPKSYHGYQSATSAITRWLVDRNLRQRAAGYRALVGRTGAILDVGAADGAHFDVWKTEGEWDLVGFEFNDAIASEARAHGRDIATATMEGFDSKGRMFDLIIMNHLLEHVQDPLGTVRRAYSMLKPGGYIVGEVPNLRSLDRMIFGPYWGGCHWPRHVHQFDPQSIGRLFVKAGLEQPRFTFPLHTSHWALSVQNALQSTKIFHCTLRNGRAWYYPFLLLAFVPINFVQKLFGYTGILGFAVRKPAL